MKQTLFDLMSIDLGRLTAAGWLVMIATLVIMIGTPFLFVDTSDPDFAKKKVLLKLVGLGSMLVSLCFYYGVKFLLERNGIQVQRPAK
jgi:hypothetical protein